MAIVTVVQHEPEIAEGISNALRAAGHSVRQCCGPEAFTCPVLQGERCDFVEEADVLVYGLGLQPVGPESDSVLFRLLRSVNPSAPLIVVDAQATGSVQIADLAHHDGFVRILMPPCEPERVASVVAEALAWRPSLGAA